MIKISNYNFLKIEDAGYHRLLIGKSGENEYRSFCFDISKWLEKYPEGIVTAIFKRPDGVTYPVAVSVDGEVVTWTVTATELAASGKGELELSIHFGEVIGKSASIITVSEISLEPTVTPTDPERNWFEDIVNRTYQAAATANEAAQKANTAAENVSDGKDGTDGKDGKSAYEYALEGGFSGTEEQFCEKLGTDYVGGAFYVTVTVNSDGTKTADKTVEEIEAAYQAGCPMFCWYKANSDWVSLPLRERAADFIWSFSTVIGENEVLTVTFFDKTISAATTVLAKRTEVPTKLSQLTNDIEIVAQSAKTFYLNLALSDDGTYTADKTTDEIEQAYQAGRPIYCLCPLPQLGQVFCVPLASRANEGSYWMFGTSASGLSLVISYYGNQVSVTLSEVASKDDIPQLPDSLPNPYSLRIYNDNTSVMKESYNGNRSVNIVIPTKTSSLENDAGFAKKEEIPSSLPNPNSITFKGAVIATYDGSGAVEVDIPAAEDAAPEYVVQEADRAAAQVLSRQSGETLSFIACADAHYSTEHESAAQMLKVIERAGQGIAHIRKKVHFDFAAMLGDLVWNGGEAKENALQAMRDVNNVLANAFKEIPNMRIMGEHDRLYSGTTLLSNNEIFANTAEYNDGVEFDPYNRVGGYCYRDFEASKIRVICINTTESMDGSFKMSEGQLLWLQNALDISEKGSGWGTVLLSHHPLDWSGSETAVMQIISSASNIHCTFHGHTHANTVSTLAGTQIPRIAIPNMCLLRNNEYSDNADFADTTEYGKTFGTASETAFSLITINPINGKVFIDNYGAGIPRQIQITPRYNNMVTSSTEYMETNIYNYGLGWKNGRYVASTAGSSDGGKPYTVATGYMAIPSGGVNAIYVRGVNVDITDHYLRLVTYRSDYTFYKYLQGNGYTEDIQIEKHTTIELLGTNYYKITPSAGVFGDGAVFFRMSFTGTGENLIISVNEPIE